MPEKTKKKGQTKPSKGGKGGSGGSNASGGKMVTLGNLNLTFNLTVPPEIITEKDPEAKFSDIASAKDCQFLLDHQELWDQIEMVSGNKSLTMLLNANKISKKKVPIDYITLDKIDYTDEQQPFKDLVDQVTQKNNLILHESEVCDCNVAVGIHLTCGEEEKDIPLTNSKNIPPPKKEGEGEEGEEGEENEGEKKEGDKKEGNGDQDVGGFNDNEETDDKNAPEKEKNDKSKEASAPPGEGEEGEEKKEGEEGEEGEEKENKFKKIKEPSLDSFEYIFIDFADFNESEISSAITLEELKDFFKETKEKGKSNIVLNVGKGDGDLEQVTELLKYPDVYIFNNRDDAHELFKKINDEKKKKEAEEKNKKAQEEIKKKQKKN